MDVDESGVVTRETIRDSIQYGVCLWLHDVATWIDELVPPVSKEEINRWAKNQEKWRDQ